MNATCGHDDITDTTPKNVTNTTPSEFDNGIMKAV